jgi:hypothetical protein
MNASQRKRIQAAHAYREIGKAIETLRALQTRVAIAQLAGDYLEKMDSTDVIDIGSEKDGDLYNDFFNAYEDVDNGLMDLSGVIDEIQSATKHAEKLAPRVIKALNKAIDGRTFEEFMRWQDKHGELAGGGA